MTSGATPGRDAVRRIGRDVHVAVFVGCIVRLMPPWVLSRGDLHEATPAADVPGDGDF